jgi:hypothetical protein
MNQMWSLEIMADDLDRIVDATLDAAIRSFCPGDENSYAHWDSELQRLELSLHEALPTPEHQHLFAEKAIEVLGAVGYETLPVDSGEMDLVRLTLQTAGEIKRVNREKGEALLAGAP